MNNDMKEEETEKNIQNIHKKSTSPPQKKDRKLTLTAYTPLSSVSHANANVILRPRCCCLEIMGNKPTRLHGNGISTVVAFLRAPACSVPLESILEVSFLRPSCDSSPLSTPPRNCVTYRFFSSLFLSLLITQTLK